MRSRLVCLGLSAVFLILPMFGLLAGNANAAAITWVGGTSSTWNTSTANWTGEATVFTTGDHVTFDDTSANPDPVTLIGVLSPGSLTVNASRDYTFNGSSSTNRLGGQGGITKNGAGTLTINAPNGFNGAVTINGGIVKLGHATALGSATGGTVVNGGTEEAPGGTLDLGGLNITNGEQFTVQGVGVGGNGALINTTDGTAIIQKLTLTGDATLGGSERVDLRGALSFGDYTLTVKHTGDGSPSAYDGIRIVTTGAWLNHDLKDANVVQGTLSFQNASLGKLEGTITVTHSPGADYASEIQLYDSYATDGYVNTVTKNLVFTGGRLYNYRGSYTIEGSMRISDMATEIFVFQPETYGTKTIIAVGITGTGGITKTGEGLLTLRAVNTYNGDTIVAAGSLVLDEMASISDSPLIDVQTGATFDVSAVTGGFTLVDGQTLMGNGTVTGGVLAADGSLIEPGASIGTLTVNGNLALAGTLLVEYDGATIDTLVVNGDLDLDGGTFDFSQFGDALTEESYVFATFTGTRTGMAAATAPANYVIAYDDLGKTVALVLVPELSSFALLFLGLLGFVARRRRP